MSKQAFIGVSFYNEAIKYLEEIKVKSLSYTLNSLLTIYLKKKLPLLAIDGDKESKQRVLRISQENKDILSSKKLAKSMSYTVNCILLHAKAAGVKIT